jgi:hypothetical protein
MKKVISASRRTDLVAFFPEWFASVIKKGEAYVHGPSGHTYIVSLNPSVVHSVVLWSKNFANVIENHSGLGTVLQKYNQLYCHFTITGLGGTIIERGVPAYPTSLSQLGDLVDIVGIPERITVRFDPIVYWEEGGDVCTNLSFFEKMAPSLSKMAIKKIRISFAQWYKKAVRRAAKHGFHFIDPPKEKKLEDARSIVRVAQEWGLELYSCSQDFLIEIPEIRPSSCIDGFFLQKLHPDREVVSTKTDKTQRTECRCTESTDIGSYAQFCPRSCIYCYANLTTSASSQLVRSIQIQLHRPLLCRCNNIDP